MRTKVLTRKPIPKLLQIGKVGTRHEKLEQSPEFRQVVLKWCPSEQETAKRPKHEQDIPSLRLEVFDHMGFIEYHIIPSLSLEYVGIPAGQRIRSDAYVKAVSIVPALPKFLPSFRAPVIAQDLEAR